MDTQEESSDVQIVLTEAEDQPETNPQGDVDDRHTAESTEPPPAHTPASPTHEKFSESFPPNYFETIMHQNLAMRRLSALSSTINQQNGPPVVEYMTRPESTSGVPPGLEYLTVVDQLLVHQQFELLEMMTGIETCNRYVVKNTMGQQIYFVGEESDLMQRQCCGPQRGFIMHVLDNSQQEVLRISRKFKCMAGFGCLACCSCCSLDVTVEAPLGQVIGHVTQSFGCLIPRFFIRDSEGQAVLKVEGPSCACRCCLPDQNFKILSLEDQEIGLIQKQWGGFVKEYYTDADNFVVQFPMDMEVKTKALLLGAVFLIDFMFFENNQGGMS